MYHATKENIGNPIGMYVSLDSSRRSAPNFWLTRQQTVRKPWRWEWKPPPKAAFKFGQSQTSYFTLHSLFCLLYFYFQSIKYIKLRCFPFSLFNSSPPFVDSACLAVIQKRRAPLWFRGFHWRRQFHPTWFCREFLRPSSKRQFPHCGRFWH